MLPRAHCESVVCESKLCVGQEIIILAIKGFAYISIIVRSSEDAEVLFHLGL